MDIAYYAYVYHIDNKRIAIDFPKTGNNMPVVSLLLYYIIRTIILAYAKLSIYIVLYIDSMSITWGLTITITEYISINIVWEG